MLRPTTGSEEIRGRCARVLAVGLLGVAVLTTTGLAEAGRCMYPLLPKVDRAAEEIRTELEADGLWRPTRDGELAPPADPQVGDTWLWYIWDLGGAPVATLKPCTVRGMGANSYVVVDDDEWNVSIDQTDVDRIVDYFENQSLGSFPDQGIWALNTSHFGDPPNPLDGLDRIFLLYYRFDISSDGYFWVFDQFPDGTQPYASNEADVVYLATDSSGGPPASDYMLAVAAHEFQHMIHYNYDTNEDSWVEEGLSELAMWLFGNPDVISSFNSNPDNSLTNWGFQWADYIQTYLWTLYAYEQYGGQPTIWDLVHNPGNGMSAYLTTFIGQGFNVLMEDVFGDWSVANFLDDPSLASGQFGYDGDTLPPFASFRTHDTFPAAGSGSVQNWATDYLRLTDIPGVPTVSFNGDDTRNFRVALMAIDPVLPTLVQPLMLDAANDGTYQFVDALGYDEVVVAIANVYPAAGAGYSYSVEVPLDPDIFDDGFESGDTSAWSVTVP